MCLFAALLCIPAYAAHNASKLTEDNVRGFILDITNKASSVDSMDREMLELFFSQHLHPKSFFKSLVVFNIPGYPSQENKVFYEKPDYIESLIQAKNAVSNFKSSVEIKKIKISGNGKKATVQTITSESAMLQVPQSGVVEAVPMTGSSSCEQTITLNSSKIIQLYAAVCRTEMSFD